MALSARALRGGQPCLLLSRSSSLWSPASRSISTSATWSQEAGSKSTGTDNASPPPAMESTSRHFRTNIRNHPMYSELPKPEDRAPRKKQASGLAATDEYEEYTMPHLIWGQEEAEDVHITHYEPQDKTEKAAFYTVKLLRFGFDIISGYKFGSMNEIKWLRRIICLETVAGVPGMMGAMARHLQSLRRFERDYGWIHTLLGNGFYGCERTSGAGGNFLNPIQSMALRTVHSFSFKYGRIEIRAKLPKGDWIWPAMWMLPKSNQYGGWPASGEIDIMESRGNPSSYAAGGVNTFGSTLHFGPHWPEDAYMKAHSEAKAPAGHDFSEDFHVFGLIWNASYIGTYLDHQSQPILQMPIKESFWQLGGYDKSKYDNPWSGRGNDAPFDQKYYLIFDMAVGGTNGFFPDGQGNKPWSDTSEHAVNEFWTNRASWSSTWEGENSAMQIDYVRVYDR